jgi:hypothetical protein
VRGDEEEEDGDEEGVHELSNRRLELGGVGVGTVRGSRGEHTSRRATKGSAHLETSDQGERRIASETKNPERVQYRAAPKGLLEGNSHMPCWIRCQLRSEEEEGEGWRERKERKDEPQRAKRLPRTQVRRS